jgi:hypothetical protein
MNCSPRERATDTTDETRPTTDAAVSQRDALEKINQIRNSIIGTQTLNWSEHVYPLVAALQDAGFEGMSYPEGREYYGTLIERAVKAEDEVQRLRAIVNTPETADFMKGVPLEAAHQRERWGANHDAGKAPLDWFWLIGYLAQKAATSAIAGDVEKAKHHTISTAAALSNWHLQLAGGDKRMRPGIAEPIADAQRPEGER